MSDLRDFTGKNRVFTGTDGERISLGTTAERVDSQGKLRFNTSTNLMEYYTGTDWKSIDSPPLITAFTVDGGSDVTTGNVDGGQSGNVTIEIKGSLFDTTGANVTFIGTSETLSPSTITRNSANLLTVTLPYSSFDEANEPYTIKVTNGSGLSAELADAISQDRPVTFTNAADTTYVMFDSLRSSGIAASDLCGATDADGDTITYSVTIGSLPTGLTLNTSTGAISGTANAEVSDTTYTFTVQAATTNLTITRQFKITVKAPQVTTYTSGSGSFSVPTGLTSVDVLVVAGGGSGGLGIPNNVSAGGAGAGGLIYRPGFTVTPGGSVPYSIGSGGVGTGSPSDNGVPGTDTTFGTLTAKGGGAGGGWNGNPGESGGSGGGGCTHQTSGGGSGGSATQPGQPGDSGTYGFGNPGGTGGPTWNNGSPGGPNTRSSGGGGAGGAGTPGNSDAAGGAGKVYSISGSPVGYAGGGGGGAGQGPGPAQHGGGVGGSPGQSPAPPGTANRGGGGGGGGVIGQTPTTTGGSGGTGVVIITY